MHFDYIFHRGGNENTDDCRYSAVKFGNKCAGNIKKAYIFIAKEKRESLY